MGDSVRASEAGLAIANQARLRRGWTKTSTARWWQDAHTSRATLRRFWRGERIQKDAFIAICQTVGLDNWRAIAEQPDLIAEQSSNQASEQTPSGQPLVDWGNAPDVEQFYGRSQALQQLQSWVLTERAKLIGIGGLGGCGKTALALALAEQVQSGFDGMIWRSLQTASSLELLLASLLETPIDTAKQGAVEQGTQQLLQKLRGRWLIILDGLDGVSPESYQAYQTFLYRLSAARHQSCILLTTRQPLLPKLLLLKGVQYLSLSGLSDDAAVKLLQASGCRSEPHQLRALAHFYGNNPLALKVVASTIQIVFGGQVAPFLAQDTIILPEPIQHLLKQQFETLTPLEKTLVFWLAIWQEPISLCRLQTHLLDAPNPTQVFEALSTLIQRSLITQHFLSETPAFSLQPMIMTFVIDELAEAVIRELAQVQQQQTIQAFQLLRTHCLLRPGTDDILGDRILNALREKYLQQFSQLPISSMEAWLQAAKDYSPTTVGYLAFNLSALATIVV